ncbi:uncharacterized protein GPR160 isoform X1 [Prionailurus iriomotensis]
MLAHTGMPGTKSKITEGSKIEIGRLSAKKDLLEEADYKEGWKIK